MKKTALVLMIVALMMFVLSAMVSAQEGAPAKAAHKYIGSAKCKVCHNSPAKGEQFKKWTDSKHSKAFETLASPEAIEVGKKLGVEKPQESDKCLGCHVTGFSAPAEAKETTFNQTEGVGCEACHGPGSDYKDMKTMKDQAAAIAAGLVIPNEKVCVGCHNEKSPTYKKFVYAEAYKVIAHPIPKEGAK